MIKSLILFLILIFVSASLLIGQSIYLNDMESGNETDIYNLTESINANNYSCEYLYNNSQNVTIPKFKIDRLNRIVCSFAQFMLTSGIETAKFGVEFGYENPEYDYEFVIKLFKFFIYAMIVIALAPLVVPIIAITYLLIIGIINTIKYINRKFKK